MTDYLSVGRQVLAAQPFSLLLGTELLEFATGSATLRVAIKPEFKQQHGFAHGGVISYAADNALTFAGGSVLGTAVVTAEFKINYVRPAKGESLIAKAVVIHAGKNQAVCQCEVFDSSAGAETLCAIAQGTITRLGSSDSSNPEKPNG